MVYKDFSQSVTDLGNNTKNKSKKNVSPIIFTYRVLKKTDNINYR